MNPPQLPTASERRAMAERVYLRWRDHPLVRDRIREAADSGPGQAPAVTTPAQVVGEMGTLVCSLALSSERPDQVESRGSEEEKAAACARLAYWLDRATPYLWLNSIIDEAMRTQVPRHIVSSHLVPTKVSWFTRETADVPFPGISRDGWLLIDHGNFLEIAEIGSRDETRHVWLHHSIIKYGQRFPEDFGDNAKATGQWLSALAFLNSPYVGAQKVRVDRPDGAIWPATVKTRTPKYDSWPCGLHRPRSGSPSRRVGPSHTHGAGSCAVTSAPSGTPPRNPTN